MMSNLVIEINKGRSPFGCQGGIADGVRNTAGRHAGARQDDMTRARARGPLCQ